MAHSAGWGPYGDAYGGAAGGPAGPGGPGMPGWGGWAPPPPQPGVIPLKPLTLGEILGGAMSTIGRYKGPVMGLAATVFGAYTLLIGIAFVVALSGVTDELGELMDLADRPGTQEPAWHEIRPLIIAFVIVVAVALIGYVLAVATVQAAMLTVLQDAVLGRPATFGSVWRRTLPRVPALIGTSLLTGLIAMVPVLPAMILFSIGAIGASASGAGDSDEAVGAYIGFGVLGFLLAFVPVVWLWVKFSLAPAAAVFEKQGPIRAMRRSSQLVRGRWWPVLGISLLAGLIAAVTAGVIQQVLSMIGLFPAMAAAADLGAHPGLSDLLSVFSVYIVITMVGQLIGYLIQSTFPPLVNGLLYVDQRIRKEDLAPDLARAAGLL
ncbi:hypothetical protein ACH4TP_28095 [Streptomyces sp. NPDC021012]|uniref:DUF7847 domain-containing protein n=1 Tax=Streptomyces sp. NPDC021012 TaxID=3365107 RepID=UPI00379D07F6